MTANTRRRRIRRALLALAGALLLAACSSGTSPTSGTGSAAPLPPEFTTTLPGVADSPAVYAAGVDTPTGRRDLLFLTTREGWIVAVDAHDGATVWKRRHGPGDCHVNNGSRPCYTTSAPVVGPRRAFVYTYGLDGFVHKHAIGTGAEVTTGGWPEVATLKPFDEKGSAHLAVATARSGRSYLYAASSGYPGDRGEYQGHVTTIDLATGAQRVFNAECSDKAVHLRSAPATPDCDHVRAAVWGRPGVVYDPRTDRVFLSTGNGDFDAAHDFGNSVLALRPDGTGADGGPLDFYTPPNFAELNAADLDLGSAAPAILPTAPGIDLAVQAGKDGMLRLLDLTDLGGHRSGNPDHTGGELARIPVPQSGEILTQPATWRAPDGSAWVFVTDDHGISGLKLSASAARSTLVPQWTHGPGGTSPIIVRGTVYYLTDHGIRGVDPVTGAQRWAENTDDIHLHWQSLCAAAGALYYPDGTGHLHAVRLPSAPR